MRWIDLCCSVLRDCENSIYSHSLSIIECDLANRCVKGTFAGRFGSRHQNYQAPQSATALNPLALEERETSTSAATGFPGAYIAAAVVYVGICLSSSKERRSGIQETFATREKPLENAGC